MREVVKLGLFLLVTCAIIGLGVSYANVLTKPIILESEKLAQQAGFKEVYAEADEIQEATQEYLTSTENSIIKEVNLAYRAGEVVGVIYTVEPRGYSSNLKTLVGFDIEKNEITNIKILSQAETPGLGAQAIEPWYVERYSGKSAEADLNVVKQPPKNENEIQGITSATITSKAVTQGVNEARKHFEENFQ